MKIIDLQEDILFLNINKNASTKTFEWYSVKQNNLKKLF